MLTVPWLLAFTLFAVSTCFSPGPNNLLLITSGARFGLARTWRQIFGTNAGFVLMVAVIGLALGALFAERPWLHDALALVGSAYLLFLTWKLLMARGTVDGAGGPDRQAAGRTIGFVEAALFQWVNPKAWVMATGAIAAYTTSAAFEMELTAILLIFALVGFCSSLTWAAAGQSIARFLTTPARLRAFNVILGLMLLASILPILLSRAPL